ncbi:MAG: hypothetical protein A2036_02130 [Omnitrophica bacterium GWA2_50_21]|nr:MAG: hypothetical protein A2036_02130 [Omnitrophica bacterium GWA2_50_21]
MIDKRELLDFAKVFDLPVETVEKDYVLGWILAGIEQEPAINSSWLFKGGTCLKKCYFETYRFSEDLDFTLPDKAHIDVDLLKEIFKRIAAWIQSQSGIQIPENTIDFELFQNPRGTPAIQGKIGYIGPLRRGSGSIAKIKLDLTNDEIVSLAPAIREVYHPYSDKPEPGIHARCYAYEEIFAEKVRALAERARPRDLYDVVHLYRHDHLLTDKKLVLSALVEKCRFKKIEVPTLEGIEKHPYRGELETEWENMLRHQLAALPPVQSFLDELPNFFNWLNELQGVEAEPEEEMAEVETATAPIPAAPVGRKPEIDTSWSVPERLTVINRESSIMEKIRFAAANRLCLDLAYDRSHRIIEPYAVKRTIDGDLFITAVRHESGQPRNYSFDKIEGIKVTDTPFNPRGPIEITSGGHLKIKQNVSSARGRSSYADGPIYIYRCNSCHRLFRKKTMDSTLRSHKNKSGHSCFGSYGSYVRTKY